MAPLPYFCITGISYSMQSQPLFRFTSITRALPHLNGYPTKMVASDKMPLKMRRQPPGWRLE